MRILAQLIILLLVGGWAAPVAGAAACGVCRTPLTESFYWVSSPARSERVAVCRACAKRDTLCFICSLPVRAGDVKLGDGRWLCETDAAQAVFDGEAMQRIFGAVKRDLHRMFHGTGRLPDGNVTAGLVDGRQLRQLQSNAGLGDRPARTLGLTHSHRDGTGWYAHRIYLLEGVGPARLAAIAAHEWTHTWLHENVPRSRQLHPDAVEGFCELVGYRLMGQRQEAVEQKIILANAYTSGQIALLAEAETEAQFLRIVEWMKSGTENLFASENVQRLLHRNPVPSFATLWRPTVRTAVPATLQLKGIGGKPPRRFALINNCTLAAQETAAVRVGETRVRVRCLDIRADAVVIQVEGQNAPVELTLR